MASAVLRREVLRSFKELHRTRLKVFEGDTMALNFAREKINEGFRKNKDIVDPKMISEQVEFAKGVEVEMRTTIVQAKEVKPGVYEAKLTQDTVKLQNVPFKDCDTQVEFTTKIKGNKIEISPKRKSACCQEQK